VARSVMLREKTMDAAGEDQEGGIGGGRAVSVSLIVPESADAFRGFVVLRDRETLQAIEMDGSGAIISEKLSSLLGVPVGGALYLKSGDGDWERVVVSGVTENYFSHYVYMTGELYEAIYGEPAEYNAIYAILGDHTAGEMQNLASRALDKKAVSAVIFVSSFIDIFNDVLQSLDFVVLVLIISAGALAFVVLLNLTSINITERVRELATIEVLGFYDREVSAYVYRENAILTVLGTALGLLLGRALHLYVILTAETDIMMFVRDIHPVSFLYAILLTLFFSVCVNVLTSGKLRKINMVEALKSIE
jgi:putative ABC transport system permease protein